MNDSRIIIHRLRAIVAKLINRSDGRVELIEDHNEQFIKLDGQIAGRSLQLCAGMDDSFQGFGLGDFAKVILEIEDGLGSRRICHEEMIQLAEFVPEDKRTKWLSLW